MCEQQIKDAGQILFGQIEKLSKPNPFRNGCPTNRPPTCRRKQVSTATATEDNRGDGANKTTS